MTFAALLIAGLGGASSSLARAGDGATAAPAASPSGGMHDFDFEFGTWRVHHRVRRPDGSWSEFDGSCSARSLTAGSANVEEHRFDKPTGITYGIGLRAYDPKTRQWAIWWLDGRDPHAALDPPVKGRFVNGVGTFDADVTVDGKPLRVRYTWSRITPISAHWEQSTSRDAGKTWGQANWLMDFQRQS